MRNITFLSLFILLIAGCGGGTTPVLVVSGIQGSNSVTEISTVTYSVTASGETDIGYDWAFEPAALVENIILNGNEITFDIVPVDADTSLNLTVTVSGDKAASVVRSISLSVKNRTNTGEMTVSQIMGSDEIQEDGGSRTYTVDVSNAAGVNCTWSIVPDSAGSLSITDGAFEFTEFTPFQVDQDTAVELKLKVTAIDAGPIYRSKFFTINNVPGFGLQAGEIDGPDQVQDNQTVSYSVSATAGDDITYNWTVDPPTTGTINDPTLSEIEFTPAVVTFGKTAELSVEITSPGATSVTKSKFVAIIKNYSGGEDEADIFLGDGHPIEGVNYHRNNRSKHQLPVNFDTVTVIDNPGANEEKIISAAVNDSDRLFFGTDVYFGYDNITSWDYEIDKWIRYWDPISGVVGPVPGGKGIALTPNNVFDARSFEDSSGVNVGPGGSSSSFEYSLIKHDHSLSELGVAQGIWSSSQPYGSVPYINGDPSLPRYEDILPLPDGRVISTADKGDGNGVSRIITLNDNPTIISQTEIFVGVTGLAFNGTSNQFYAASDSELIVFDFMLDTIYSSDGFSDFMPVIADDDTVLGVNSLGIRRYSNADGIIGSYDIELHSRPALLSDGTILVIGDSEIEHLTLDFADLGSVPLPAGIGADYIASPLIDSSDYFAMFLDDTVYLMDLSGVISDQYTCAQDIVLMRLGLSRFYVLTEDEIYVFNH